MATAALFAECKSDLQKFAGVARPKIRELFGGLGEKKTALVAYKPKEAVAKAMALTPQAYGGKPVDPAYPWGVQWTGHADLRTCKVDIDEMKKAFKTWENFSVFDQETVNSLAGPFKQYFDRAAEQQAERQAAVPLTTEGNLHKNVFQILNQGNLSNDDKIAQLRKVLDAH
jgi:hypothetical protein